MNARPNGDHEILMKVAADVAALNARLDATLPQLATRTDLERSVNRAMRWLIGVLLAGFAGMGGVFMNMSHEFHSESIATREAMQQQQRWQTGQMQAQNARFDAEMRADREAARQETRALSGRVDRVIELLQSPQRRELSK